jgi:hypothetical protein
VRWIEAIHGHAGVLAVAALYHPAIILWRGAPLSRGSKWAISLSTSLCTVAFAIGTGIYEAYRAQIRPELAREHREIALLFETKEHLAFAALCLALGALACAWLAPRGDAALRKLAARLYLSAALLATIVAALGTHVASVRSF